ncbi:MAG: TetR/AcrR family transcriptional regulator [Caldicoprobacterales bacterium]|jgi:AcrR family transcriptional regulator|nr:TetR/AcrR family transcriptional regulator [Clostridiales bacterium]
MKEKKTDQRIRLTRTLLKNALVQLMQENHISKISVRALCETAGINRSTFYLHYTDPYDLLASVEKEVLDNLNQHLNLQSIVDKQPLSSQVMTRVLDYVKENVDLFKALLSENCDYAFQRDLMELAQVLSSQPNQSLDQRTIGYVKDFCLSGTISVLQKWLQEGMQESTAQISEFIVQIMYFGLSSVSNDLLQN